ncbi:hypothetical protein NMG29_06675 [Streptomyces cocklensis]|uniref:Uncharacterized protein n=1 Tax=Actinacidiphila cocklensis TaxID=887465 RepID=A0A9W4DSM1_9ACTN|nr:hypothetical protein [Actinacidiphila cocklensis]MDD1057916.1 hypothetical protein [Actinacidiphila cocklensis]CAG6392781.1 conserved hypothetical protein [Actinacidiphila cocklensis]
MAIPGNFLSATTEMVDPDTSGWQATLNCTKSLGSQGRNGDGVLTLTSVASGEMQASTVSTYPIVAGTVYQTFADASSANEPERIGIQWLNDSLVAVGSTTWSPTTNTASATLHRISVAGPAPAGATRARVVLSASPTAAARAHFFENVYLGAPWRTSGNLLSFNVESGGEIDATGWAVDTNSTVSRDVPMVQWPVSWYYSGGCTIKMTVTANGNASMKTAEAPAVVPGTEYVGSAYLSPPTAGASCWIELRWLNASGTLISTKRAVLAQPSTGVFRQYVSGIAPAGAATVVLATGITSATAAQVLRIDSAVVQVAVPIIAGSVVPFEDASFEAGIGQWTVASGVATLARSTPWNSVAYNGAYWLIVTSSTASTSVLLSGRYPVTPGVSWRPQGQFVAAGGAWGIAPNLRWYNAAGTLISTSALPADSIPGDGQWWRDWNDIVAPAGAATAAIQLTVTAPAAAATLVVDAVALLQTVAAFAATANSNIGSVTLVLRELDPGDLLTVYRIVGATQTLVRGPAGWISGLVLVSDQLTVEDYEAPIGVEVTYRFEMHDATTGASAGGGTSNTVSLTLPDISDCWVKDPLQPQRNMLLQAAAAPDWTRPIEQTEHRIRGRRNSVILSDVRGGLTGTLQVWTMTDEGRAGLHYALDTGNPLLIQFSPGLGLEDAYFAVGEVTEPRLIAYGGEPRRRWSLPLTEVDAPIGGTGGTAGWTVQDVATTYATVQAVFDTYATVLDLILDNREV